MKLHNLEPKWDFFINGQSEIGEEIYDNIRRGVLPNGNGWDGSGVFLS